MTFETWPGIVRRPLLAGLLLLALASTALAQSPAPTALDLARLGPQVGERAPDFSLTDQSGVTHTLQSILGPNGALLVFFRSADW